MNDEEIIGKVLEEHDIEFGAQMPWNASWLIQKALSLSREQKDSELKIEIAELKQQRDYCLTNFIKIKEQKDDFNEKKHNEIWNKRMSEHEIYWRKNDREAIEKLKMQIKENTALLLSREQKDKFPKNMILVDKDDLEFKEFRIREQNTAEILKLIDNEIKYYQTPLKERLKSKIDFDTGESGHKIIILKKLRQKIMALEGGK